MLNRLRIRHERDLNRYQSQEGELPQLLTRHSEEVCRMTLYPNSMIALHNHTLSLSFYVRCERTCTLHFTRVSLNLANGYQVEINFQKTSSAQRLDSLTDYLQNLEIDIPVLHLMPPLLENTGSPLSLHLLRHFVVLYLRSATMIFIIP